MTRHPGHGNRGQGRKGGGRESGSGDEVAPVATESGYAPAHTAANPAALSLEVRKSIEEAIEANRPLIERVGLEVLLRVLFKAYHILEAENWILTDVMRKEIAKVRALEAELARAEIFRKDLSNAFLADARDLKVRAEKAEVALKAMTFSRDEQLRLRMKAEARVKELEADLARHQDGERTAK